MRDVKSDCRFIGSVMNTVSLDDLECLRELDQDVVGRRARRKAALDQATAVREKIAARVAGFLPDSADELRELRGARR